MKRPFSIIVAILLLALTARGETPAKQHIILAPDELYRSNECRAANFTVDGDANLPAYPWGTAPNAPVKFDALVVEGGSFIGEHLCFRQIPGAALRLKGGPHYRGTDISAFQTINGIVLETPDGKFGSIHVDGTVHDGLTLAGPGMVVEMEHSCGADRACVVSQPATVGLGYNEAGRIGTDILGGADGTTIEVLNIGPATCWERGVRIGCNAVTIGCVKGMVQGESPVHPNIAGVEILGGLVHQVIAGDLVMDGDGSDGVILRGSRNKIDLKGGWNKKVSATFIRADGRITGCRVTIRGSGSGGTAFDGSTMIDGGGNDFDFTWDGDARFNFPKRDRTSRFTVNGVVQQ